MATDFKQEPKVRLTPHPSDWHIEKTARQCCVCNRQFLEEEHSFSALYDEIQQFTRKDFCIPCWSASGGDEKGAVFSFWKTRIPKADIPPKKHVDNAALMDFFIKLEDSEDPRKQNLRYALALYLMRKKLLKYKGTVGREGREHMQMEYAQEDRVFEVFHPQLTDEEITDLTNNLLQLFDTDVPL